ncbi:MAG: diguanylate cyclase [Betaproteobacteria bacterium]|nr:MAG: diguanylate cyclase [Betaproteobacteria bacterium]
MSDLASKIALIQGRPALKVEQLATLFDSTMAANISVFDLDARLLYVNDLFARSFKRPPSELVGKTLYELYAESHIAQFRPYLERVLAGEAVTYERLSQVVDTTGVWYTVALTPWRDESGTVIGGAQVSMRVHEMKAALESLRVAQERLASHMNNSPLVAIELDAALNVSQCGVQAFDLIGIPPEQIVGRSLLQEMRDRGEQGEPLVDALQRLQSGAEVRNRVEVALSHVNGKTIYTEWFNSALTDANGRVSSIMSLVQDVTARTLADVQLRRFVTHDTLTGLHNRRGLTERLNQCIVHYRRADIPLALMFIDLDGFKQVNDLHGHGAGDELLCEVARRLLAVVRGADLVARIGGDEFVVLVERDATLDAVNTLGGRILRALEAPCGFTGGAARVGASIGVAMCPPGTADAVELMRSADSAMYQAKRAGKGRVVYANLSLAASARTT